VVGLPRQCTAPFGCFATACHSISGWTERRGPESGTGLFDGFKLVRWEVVSGRSWAHSSCVCIWTCGAGWPAAAN